MVSSRISVLENIRRFRRCFPFTIQYEDVQEGLRKELEVRTQGPSEEISTSAEGEGPAGSVEAVADFGKAARSSLSEAASILSFAHREEGFREFSGVAEASGRSYAELKRRRISRRLQFLTQLFLLQLISLRNSSDT